MKLAEKPPIGNYAAALGLEGKTPQCAVEQKIDLIKRSQHRDVQKAWAKLTERDGMDKGAFEKAKWRF